MIETDVLSNSSCHALSIVLLKENSEMVPESDVAIQSAPC